jgi:hypothetical protein
MPFIRIFEVPLIYHYLICDRYSADRYQLEYGELKCLMSLSDARSLGNAGSYLKDRRGAMERGRRTSMKPGPVFRRWLPVVDGNTKVLFEIGVVDSGDATYFEADGLHAELGIREEELCEALGRLRADVGEVAVASEPPPRPYSPGRDYRSRWMPFWDN